MARRKLFAVRLDDTEREELDAGARAAGMTLTEFMRRAALAAAAHVLRVQAEQEAKRAAR